MANFKICNLIKVEATGIFLKLSEKINKLREKVKAKVEVKVVKNSIDQSCKIEICS